MNYHHLSHSQIEYFADSLNKRYDPVRLKEPKPIDVYDIIDLVGAKTAIDCLSPDMTYLGITIFQTRYVYIWPGNPYRAGMMPTRKLYTSDTIIIEKYLNESPYEHDHYKENFTVAHECFHFSQHRYYFTQNNNNSIFYNSDQKQQIDYKTDRFVEHEANYGAATLLMPRQAVIHAAHELLHYNDQIINSAEVPKCIIKQMGQLFGVNYSPIFYRLLELKIISEDKPAPQFNDHQRTPNLLPADNLSLPRNYFPGSNLQKQIIPENPLQPLL
ncbi:MAG: ImmA/IrrE family metallo-endopeptidase [bacterium]|nr:ImmA/IrrE family metallo-endopeptidase [bacterium]